MNRNYHPSSVGSQAYKKQHSIPRYRSPARSLRCEEHSWSCLLACSYFLRLPTLPRMGQTERDLSEEIMEARCTSHYSNGIRTLRPSSSTRREKPPTRLSRLYKTRTTKSRREVSTTRFLQSETTGCFQKAHVLQGPHASTVHAAATLEYVATLRKSAARMSASQTARPQPLVDSTQDLKISSVH